MADREALKKRLAKAMRLPMTFLRLMPRELERLHLYWALKEIDPMHPDVHFIVHRINELERA